MVIAIIWINSLILHIQNPLEPRVMTGTAEVLRVG